VASNGSVPDGISIGPNRRHTDGSRANAPTGTSVLNLTSDQQILWQRGFLKLNGTIVTTWATMFFMAAGSKLVTRRLVTEGAISRWQGALEIIVSGIETQIEDVGLTQPARYISFLGTLFLFVALSSVCTIIPGYQPPTGSLSTTAALAICVFIAVPLFGIWEQGLGSYLKTYTQPTVIMLPFNIIGELSRTLALAVRLFGNMMSGVMIIAILLTITPFIFPIAMTALSLLTGMVQAYIFSILAGVYIAAATLVKKKRSSNG
jgi:F-type H+-transporting ATPase subunit a